MKKEPKKIKLNPESPTTKEVRKIPMPSLEHLYRQTIAPDNDSVYTPIDWKELPKLETNENHSKDDTESIQ